MWEFLQIILKNNITPNQCLLLYSLKEGIRPSIYIEQDMVNLINQGFYKSPNITDHGKKLMRSLDNYFIKAKKKTAADIMGKDYLENVKKYRETFPTGKLPSGVPARNNVKILTENFRWFFDEFDYTWDEVHKAVNIYIAQYRAVDWEYMQNSQYLIAKQDKHKVKTSKLADYCDMARDGIEPDENFHFKEKVV